MKFFTYTLPKFIKRNGLGEHKYMFPMSIVAGITISLIASQMGVIPQIARAAAFIPFVYYLYLVFNLIENEYHFDLSELGLSERAERFLRYAATAYEDDIRFYAHRMTNDVWPGYEEEERISLLKEINKSIKTHKTHLDMKFFGHTYCTDMSNVDRNLVELFVKNVDAYFSHESLLSIRNIGVDV